MCIKCNFKYFYQMISWLDSSDHQISSCVRDPLSIHREERQPSWESSLGHRERSRGGACSDLPAGHLPITVQTQR